ncbi:MAG: PRC-barrel domain-containing protein [Burkholderiaceae bacterium]
MLRTLEELHDYAIGAVDGAIGHVKDLYVDDEAWVVRYLVVKTGGWLMGKRVLISPMAVGHADWATRQLPVSITMEQVRNSPDIDTEKPVTRQHEVAYSEYYGYPTYWGGMGYWGSGMYPNMIAPGYGGYGSPQAIRGQAENAGVPANADSRADADPHLRSCAEITGYHLHASDGEIGHVCGMLIDDETWAVRYLVVETSNWWFGHRMLVAPTWIEAVSWEGRTVSVTLTRQTVRDAPAYDPDEGLTRAEETRLHEHYGRTGYWTDADKRQTDASHV